MLRRLIALTLLFTGPAGAATCDAVWRDAARARDLPVRIRLPDARGKVPAVLWSPGLGGTRTGGEAWARGWAAIGLAVIQLEHPGSDAAVYAGAGTPEERRARVRAAASAPQLLARAGDVSFIADELARRPKEGACDLARIDMDRLGLAGHSMGAWTVQAIAGEAFGKIGPVLMDRRFRAFVAFSPTARPGMPVEQAFGAIHRPVLAITGTLDGAPASADAAFRAAVLAQRTGFFAGLPADGRKAQAVFDAADHMMFAGNRRPASDRLGLKVQAHALALTRAWWQRWLLGDAAAESVLAKPGLTAPDQWQRK
jgi:predicted dienelactone hydrolase